MASPALFISSKIPLVRRHLPSALAAPLLPYDIRAPLATNPDLVHPPCIDVEPGAGSKRFLLLRVFGIPRVSDGEGATQDEMRREAGV